jgi:hypothetical protein
VSGWEIAVFALVVLVPLGLIALELYAHSAGILGHKPKSERQELTRTRD